MRDMPWEVKMYWNSEYSIKAWSTVGLVHIFSEETAISMKQGAFVMYPLHAALLNFSAELLQKPYFQCIYTCRVFTG